MCYKYDRVRVSRVVGSIWEEEWSICFFKFRILFLYGFGFVFFRREIVCFGDICKYEKEEVGK